MVNWGHSRIETRKEVPLGSSGGTRLSMGLFAAGDEVPSALTQKIVIRHAGDEIPYNTRRGGFVSIGVVHAFQEFAVNVGVLVACLEVLEVFVKEEFEHKLDLSGLFPAPLILIDPRHVEVL